MESMSVQNFRDFYCRIWPPGVFELSKNAKNKKNQRKLKLTSSLFIIYSHNELQTCRGHGVHECAKLQGFLLSHLATRGLQIVKKCKKTRKFKENLN